MKRIIEYLLLLVALTCCLGCKKKLRLDITAPQTLWRTYVIADLCVYALGDEGTLYTIEGDTFSSEPLRVCSYGADGKQLSSKQLEDSAVKTVTAMTFCENVLYFASPEAGGSSLYRCDPWNGTVSKVLEAPKNTYIQRIVADKERLFLLGAENEKENGNEGSIFLYTIVGHKLEELGIEAVVDIAKLPEGDLLVYHKDGEEYSFLQYQVQESTARVLAKTKERIAFHIAAGPKENSIVYTSRGEGNNIVYVELANLERKTEVYPQSTSTGSFTVVNGLMAAMLKGSGFEDRVIVMDITKINTDNPEIRYLTGEDGWPNPYGCGFTIRKEKMNADKMVLKLLAQDTDFDMTYVNTWVSSVTGVRDSGCFFPLNDVPGGMEYLDRCFPYIKEAVTDEDGNIWMLPVNVNIPVLVFDTGYCDEKGYEISENMTYEDFYKVMDSIPDKEREKTDSFALCSCFMTEYFCNKKSVDTPEFRRTMGILQKIYPLLNKGGNGMAQEYIFKGVPFISSADLDYVEYFYGGDARVYAMPKMSAEAKNVGTCQGFIVNPKSDNLGQTLRYVATWVAYQMYRENPPVFFATPENRTDSYIGSLYRVYENGTLTMGVDTSLYAGCLDVLENKRDLEEYIRETEPKLKIYFNE